MVNSTAVSIMEGYDLNAIGKIIVIKFHKETLAKLKECEIYQFRGRRFRE